MISVDKRLIFIHLPKTGGKTIRHLLLSHPGHVGKLNLTLGMHFHLSGVVQNFPNINLDEYTVLMVKRNPWDRLASLYVQLQRQFDTGVVKNKPNHPPEIYYPFFKNMEFVMTAITINGVLPRDLYVIDFDNMERDTKVFFKTKFGLILPSIPIINNKPEPIYHEMHQKIMHNQKFLDVVAKGCKKEIEYFGYTIPTLTSSPRLKPGDSSC